VRLVVHRSSTTTVPLLFDIRIMLDDRSGFRSPGSAFPTALRPDRVRRRAVPAGAQQGLAWSLGSMAAHGQPRSLLPGKGGGLLPQFVQLRQQPSGLVVEVDGSWSFSSVTWLPDSSSFLSGSVQLLQVVLPMSSPTSEVVDHAGGAPECTGSTYPAGDG